MANIANPLPYIRNREYGLLYNLKSRLFDKRLDAAKNLYRRDLVCHYGCVNAIEFSSNGELLVSGGDDQQVMLWQFGKAIFDKGKPEPMKAVHKSNIFCLGITSDNKWVYSGGNDDIVIAHDLESKTPLEILPHQRAVCSLSIDPFNNQVVTTAGNDGRLLLFDTRQSVHESLVIARSRKAFHGVHFHPHQAGFLVSANARDGVALWDLRAPKRPALRYYSGPCHNGMSVRFNAAGTQVVALRRRMGPVLYAVDSPKPLAEFYHQDYYNSCTMKSGTFAGERDQYVLSGSDDFNLYMWKVPDADCGEKMETAVEAPHLILYGHRSIVNQVRYNPNYCLIASSGVEKIIKIWSGLEYPKMRGDLLEEAQGPDNPREIYSHQDYVSLVYHSGQYVSNNHAEQSTSEDPRMMAFFDSLVQRELECAREESDSRGRTSSASGPGHESDSGDSDQLVVDFLPLPPRRVNANGARSQRCPVRLARLVTTRYTKHSRTQKRNAARRSKPPQSRSVPKSTKGVSGVSCKGARTPARRARGPRRGRGAPRCPSSELSDSDAGRGARACTILKAARRRMNSSRAVKRKKYKVTSYIKFMNLNGVIAQDSDFEHLDNQEENLAVPSTSTGYRGQSAPALFRIAEVDSDDDQPAGSLAISPPEVPELPVPTSPVNGDTLPLDLGNVTPDRRINLRRRKNGRALQRSDDSSESPLNEPTDEVLTEHDFLPRHSRSVARLMNETNESERDSSASADASHHGLGTPDSGIATLAGSSTRNPRPDDVSDDPDHQARFRHRVKKARRNYRNHIESDST